MTAILKIFGLPGTIALFAAIVLAALLALCGLALLTARAALDSADAKLAVAESQRDSAAQTAGTNATAANKWKGIAEERLVLLKAVQAENIRVATDNEAAMDRARAEAVDAGRTLEQFMARFAISIRSPDCAAARDRLDAACPLVNY